MSLRRWWRALSGAVGVMTQRLRQLLRESIQQEITTCDWVIDSLSRLVPNRIVQARRTALMEMRDSLQRIMSLTEDAQLMSEDADGDTEQLRAIVQRLSQIDPMKCGDLSDACHFCDANHTTPHDPDCLWRMARALTQLPETSA